MRRFILKIEHLPRQARDKHRENSKKEDVFSQVYNQKPIFYGCGPLVDDYWFRWDVRNDLALLYNVHVSLAAPRQIERVTFVPLKRRMATNDQTSSILQTNRLQTTDPDWDVLHEMFVSCTASTSAQSVVGCTLGLSRL